MIYYCDTDQLSVMLIISLLFYLINAAKRLSSQCDPVAVFVLVIKLLMTHFFMSPTKHVL